MRSKAETCIQLWLEYAGQLLDGPETLKGISLSRKDHSTVTIHIDLCRPTYHSRHANQPPRASRHWIPAKVFSRVSRSSPLARMDQRSTPTGWIPYYTYWTKEMVLWKT